MKFIAHQNTLIDALDYVRSTAISRTTVPILSCIRFIAKDGQLQLTGTNLEMQSDVTIPCDVSDAGTLCIPAELIHGVVRGFSKGAEIAMELREDARMQVSAGRSRINVVTLPAVEFAVMADVVDAVAFEMDAGELLQGLGAVSYAVATEASRPALLGVSMQSIKKRMVLAATDGHRLAKIILGAVPDMPPIIVPAATIKVLMGALKDAETVRVEVTDHVVRFTVGADVLTSKLLGYTYPEYDRVIPKGVDKQLSLYAEPLADAVARATVVQSGSNAKVPVLTLSVKVGERDLTIHAMGKDGNESTEYVDAETTGEVLNVSLNAHYLADALKAWPYPGTPIDMHHAGGGSPILLRSEDHPDMAHVIMPTRLP